MSILSIIKDVALRCNYVQPSSAISSPDVEIQRMLAFALDTGEELVERVDWQALKFPAPASFTGDGVTTLFTLPTGFQRLSPSDIFVSSAYPTITMPGPINDEDLLRAKAFPVSLYPSMWREVGGQIEFYPALQAGEVVTYTYAKGQWITSSIGVAYSPPSFQADTDLVLFPEKLIRMGAIWRWKKSKGLDYSEEMQNYERSLERTSAQETTTRMISTTTRILVNNDTWPGIIIDNTDQSY